MLNAPPILRLLLDNRVEFVVVGGLAMVTQGSATITEDLDLCYARTPQNITRLAAAVAPLNPYLRGAPPGLPFRFNAPTIAAGLNFTLTTDEGPVDFLGEIAGIGGYAEVCAQSERHEIYDLPIRVLSLDGLIVSKKAAGRTKDRLHLLELVELKKLREAESKYGEVL
jgi:predicted nucleotidyltransferase